MSEVAARMRASDAEREEIVAVLRSAMTAGRLTLEEGEERMASVYAARFRDEFGALVADLPEAQPKPVMRAAATRPGIGGHFMFVLLAAALLTGLWALSGAQFFWPVFPLVFLVMGLFRHAAWARGHGHHHGRGPRGRSHRFEPR